MKHKRWLMLALVATLAAGGTAAYFHFTKAKIKDPGPVESREARMVRLIDELQSQDDPASVATSLAHDYGPEARDAIPILCYRYGRGVQRNVYGDALSHIVPNLNQPSGLTSSRKSGVHVEEQVYLTMKKLGREPLDAYLTGLIEALKDENPAPRSSAAWALSVMGEDGHRAIPALTAVVKKPANPFGSDSFSAAHALLGLGQYEEASAGFLTTARLAYPMEDATTAIAALGKMGIKARSAVPGLLDYYRRLKKDKDLIFSQGLRWKIEEAVKQIGFPDALFADVVKMLKAEDRDEQKLAAKLLGGAGQRAKDAVPDLIAALRDFNVAREAAQALGDIRDARAVPVLRSILASDPRRGEGTVAVALALWKIEAKAELPVAAILKCLKFDQRPSDAAEALLEIGPPVLAAVPDLIAILQGKGLSSHALKESENIQRRVASALVLGKLGADAKEAVPALREALKEDDLQVRVAAALGLYRVGKQAQESVPVLKAILELDDEKSTGNDDRAAADAVHALGEIGPDAKSALPTLLKAKNKTGYDRYGINASAAEAIKKIDPELARKEGIR